MATYTTKFNIGDTAYFISGRDNVVSVVIIDTYIHDSAASVLNGPDTPYISYKVSYGINSSGVGTEEYGPSVFNERQLFYLTEAKAQMTIILAQKAQNIQAMQ